MNASGFLQSLTDYRNAPRGANALAFASRFRVACARAAHGRAGFRQTRAGVLEFKALRLALGTPAGASRRQEGQIHSKGMTCTRS